MVGSMRTGLWVTAWLAIAAFAVGCGLFDDFGPVIPNQPGSTEDGSSGDGGDGDTDGDTDGDSDTDTDGDGDTDSDSDSDTDTDTDGDADTDTDADSDTDADGDSDCTGQPDFTPCQVTTIPDRDYDICVDEICVSPGCDALGCNVPGPHFPLADTNQRSCYDVTSLLDPCPTQVDTFYGQDAQYGWDTSHDSSLRYSRAEPVKHEPVVEDLVTGLVWQGCAAGLTGLACDTGTPDTILWTEAPGWCEALDWAGFTDWRLPDPYELASLVDRQIYEPSIDVTAFPATPADYFWTLSTTAASADYAWAVSFSYGTLREYGKNGTYYVRCVRGVPAPQAARFTVSSPAANQPVVQDLVTGLVWQGCANGQTGTICEFGDPVPVTWGDALAECEGLDWGTYTDWRLPNIIELESIVDPASYNPCIDKTAFTMNASMSWFWASTTYPGDGMGGFAWAVGFDYGRSYGEVKSGTGQVRCVRGGD